MSHARRNLCTSLLAAAVLLAGCGAGAEESAAAPGASRAGGVLRLAVTTSTRDSGLLEVLVPAFEERYGVRVDVIAVGTGAALQQGREGNVDAVLVHSRADEDAFMAAGHAVRREDVMVNTFELLGPPSDPAGVRGLTAPEALQRIAARGQRFVSRGDRSGTHVRELALWAAGGGLRDWEHYLESGQGMAGTLTMADQLQAYVLSDRGTWLKRRDDFELVPLAARSDQLDNPYGILVIDPAKHANVRADLGHAFADYLISTEAQRRIRDYTVDAEPLFHPLRLAEDE